MEEIIEKEIIFTVEYSSLDIRSKVFRVTLYALQEDNVQFVMKSNTVYKNWL
ncbi:hypothetical protein N9H39_07225 [Gammaproteobacteria bacterium]|nr:hypothetical protein [Gammaproteobacteria bacterium]